MRSIDIAAKQHGFHKNSGQSSTHQQNQSQRSINLHAEPAGDRTAEDREQRESQRATARSGLLGRWSPCNGNFRVQEQIRRQDGRVDPDFAQRRRQGIKSSKEHVAQESADIRRDRCRHDKSQ